MGVGVSSWRLARRVAELGQLGVVSGTAVAVTLARRLAEGVDDGPLRRSLDRFPDPALVHRVEQRYRGRTPHRGERFPAVPRPTVRPGAALEELTVVANFVEVDLAKHGHDGLVGINFLEKIQLPTLPSLYGALLAGVDHVLMGAGVPAAIPAVLDRLSRHEDVALPVAVADDPSGERVEVTFSARRLLDLDLPPVRRPTFLAIVSSATLATYLARNRAGQPDGFVVEAPTAGGHNAPPRGRLQLDEHGAPIYGPRDRIDTDAIAALGLPFWLAGGFGSPERLAEARACGATGIQVGTAFALCDESGLAPELRRRLLEQVLAGAVQIRTDARASPTGFPFKVAEVAGTLSDPSLAAARPRRCDLGYLREPYRRPDGKVGYRCAAEPVDDYVRKGGTEAAADGRQCLCNGLLATIGLGQTRRDGYVEPALITAGDELHDVRRFVPAGADSYTAADVIDHLLQRPDAGVVADD